MYVKKTKQQKLKTQGDTLRQQCKRFILLNRGQTLRHQQKKIILEETSKT